MNVRTIGSVLDQCARSYAGEVAQIVDGRRVTYDEMFDRIRSTGRALRSLGLGPGDRVAFVMQDSAELLAVMYGTLWAGLTIVPLNARLAADDHAYMLQDSDARALVFDAAYAERGHELLSRVPVKFGLATASDAVPSGGACLTELAGREPGGPGAATDVDGDDGIWIQYSGGTTGFPKGALHSSTTWLHAFTSCALEMDMQPGDLYANVAPLTHAGLLHVVPLWMRGGAQVVQPGFDPERLLDVIERERVNSLFLVPTMIYALLDQPRLRDRALDSLSTIVYGAAPMAAERLEEALDVFGPVFVQIYGQVEAPAQITTLHKRDHRRAADRPELLASCGRPCAIAEVRIADDELHSVGVGEIGEIVCRGPHVMLEYINKPEETAATIQDGWLRTGDVGRQEADGYVYIMDRKKDLIITGGFNVYPTEVEQVLFTHPAVADVVVVGVPDDKWGEAVKAVVVLRGEGASAEDLIRHVKDRKGSLMAPKSVEFVDAMPLTAVGKHDRKAVRARYWDGRTRNVN